MLIQSDQEFTKNLDAAAAELGKEHTELLDQAALEHKRIQEGAQREQQRLVYEEELRKQKREEDQKRELERLQQEKARHEAEVRQRELANTRRQEEAARQAAEQQKQILEAESRVRAQREQEEAARKQNIQDEASRKAKLAATAQAQMQAPQPTPQAPQPLSAPRPPTATAVTPAPIKPQATHEAHDFEAIHSAYLQLHKRMKAFWKPFKKEVSHKDNPFKGPVGDMRRDLRTSLGQITVNREDTKKIITKVREILRRTRAVGGPTIDVRPFLISQNVPTISNAAEAQYPSIMLYSFICLEKSVIQLFDKEAASSDGRIMQELGAIAASLFVDKEFVWNQIPMIDILLAKLHKACPILFGIRGDMNTPQGRERLGWIPISGMDPETISYNQRMQGLANGFAAISLRAVPTPAIPMSEYWRAVASVCNTPTSNLYNGHFMVVRGLTRDFAKKFIVLYGAQAKAVLQKATITLPARASAHAAEAANLVKVLPDTWKQQGLRLD
jgi:nucleoporin GLE1